jgi:Cu(I)/Ag(I) efflux system membrane fusion protein
LDRVAVAFAAAGVLSCSGPSGPSDADGLEATAGPFRVLASFEPNPPQAGENVVRVRVRDDAGPVDGAQVEGQAVMPAMGAMPEMRARSQGTPLGDGTYRLDLELSMNGSWPLTLSIRDADGRTGRTMFDYKTGVPVRVEGRAGAGRPETVEDAGVVRLDARQRQLIGVKTAPVETQPASVDVRAVGRVTWDETGLTDVTLKFRGWIGEVRVNTTGAPVEEGEILFTVYAPELLSAQEEFLESVRRGSSLVDSARRRLRLWNLTDAQIDALAARGEPLVYVPIHSPAGGVVVEKNVVDGSSVEPGQLLYRIADLSDVWVEAEIYEADVPLVKAGQRATVGLSYLPGETFEGDVDYVYPYLDARPRTGRIRVVVPNPDGRLKPEMWANVELSVPLGDELLVPGEAVLRAGKTDLVFVDLGEGRLAPRTVRLGRKTAQGYVVLGGLEPGETVVTSGNFLIASESKLKSGADKW